MKRSFFPATLFCLTSLHGLFLASPARAADQPPNLQTVWLDSLPLAGIIQGWGAPQSRQSVQSKPISIAGKKFERGLG
ncbi:MAG: NPCBM/NEW2 domain-containing protein, partial [Chloroflexi bacterium]|nr:NPCBM/NEW2 domain-containing protein [Chloroflexota bacterium]